MRYGLKKAVLGTFDDICLLTYDTENNVSGFVTLRRLSESEARVGLLAVMPNRIGQGIGKQLMSAAKLWCQQQRYFHLICCNTDQQYCCFAFIHTVGA